MFHIEQSMTFVGTTNEMNDNLQSLLCTCHTRCSFWNRNALNPDHIHNTGTVRFPSRWFIITEEDSVEKVKSLKLDNNLIFWYQFGNLMMLFKCQLSNLREWESGTYLSWIYSPSLWTWFSKEKLKWKFSTFSLWNTWRQQQLQPDTNILEMV